MCFSDSDTYTTRTYAVNGTRVEAEYSAPRMGMSWRRQHGLGGSYYPSRYYSRPPTNHDPGRGLTYPARYPQHASYRNPQHSHEARYAMVPRRYSSGHGQSYLGARDALLPYHAGSGMVSAHCHPSILPSFLVFFLPFPNYTWPPFGHIGTGANPRLRTSEQSFFCLPRDFEHSSLNSNNKNNNTSCQQLHWASLVISRPGHSFIPNSPLLPTMEAYPKPRHQYVYTPRYGQRGYLSYAGQQANGAYPTGVIPNAGYGAGIAYGGYGYNGLASAAYYHPGVYAATPYHTSYHASNRLPSYSPAYGGYYNYSLYGSMYPLANFYHPYQRTYYNTAPTYGYASQAYVYPPGPSATTTTTTYHVTNSHAGASGYSPATAYAHQTRSPQYTRSSTREDVQMESRRVATERGAYSARRIKPADAREDDPFWCREKNGEWHLRTYYQIENECHPGTWQMDAEVGFLIFRRE